MMTLEQKAQLLEAQADAEVNDAFGTIFYIVHDARKVGDFRTLNELVDWIQSDSVIRCVHFALLLSAVRLTFSIRGYLHSWGTLLSMAKDEASRRGIKDVDRVFWGL